MRRTSGNKKQSKLFTDDSNIELEEFHEMIAEHAYLKAEKRGFEPSHEMDDWLEAEMEISNQ
jgi:hypothetical protein